ncbi:MAG: VanZ family protein [Deferrisomatales bacterium]|nr:VanZ family protein [Deferrisomatales bacterium]
MQEPDRAGARGRGISARWVAAAAALAYMGAIFALSHTSHPPIPAFFHGWSDKALHAVQYAPLAFLWGAAFRGSPGRRALLGWVVAGVFGLTDELHQGFVPGRHASVLDWIADLAGAAAGACLLALALRLSSLRRRGGPRP